MDLARWAARSVVRLLPASDRLIVVHAEGISTPVTLFESDRQKIQKAIDQTQPGAAPLSIQDALDFAQQAQRLHSQRPGEIVFVGAGRVSGDKVPSLSTPPNLRIIPINGPSEHFGLRKVSVRRSFTDTDTWEVFVAVKNYGTKARSLPPGVQFGGAPVGTRRLALKPGADDNDTLRF